MFTYYLNPTLVGSAVGAPHGAQLPGQGGSGSGGDGGAEVAGWTLKLVMEYCNEVRPRCYFVPVLLVLTARLTCLARLHARAGAAAPAAVSPARGRAARAAQLWAARPQGVRRAARLALGADRWHVAQRGKPAH